MADEDDPFLPDDTSKEDDNRDRSAESTTAVDFYGLLNVAKDASTEEISKAYRRISTTFHPDRHRDESLREKATQKFAHISHVYEVLSDPVKRQIYDLYGEEGLSTITSLELGPRLTTADEIKAELERLHAKRARQQEESKVAWTGLVNASVNGMDLFNMDSYTPWDVMEGISLQSLYLNQSAQVRVSPKDMLVGSGFTVTRAGSGMGYMSMGWRRQFSARSWGQMNFVASHEPSLSLVGHRTLSSNTTGQITVNLDPNTMTGVDITLRRVISKHSTAHISYGFGNQAGVSTGFKRRGRVNTLGSSVTVGDGMNWNGSYSRKISDNTHFKVLGKFGSRNVDLEIGGSRKISSHSRFDFHLLVGVAGVRVRFKVGRGQQKLQIPILLSNRLERRFVALSALVPSVLILATRMLWIIPRKRKRTERKLAIVRERQKEHVVNMREEAEADVQLMTETVARKVAREEGIGGIIILEGEYGNLKGDLSRQLEAPFSAKIDVTTALQYMVEDSQLHLQAASKVHLTGFFDCCPGEPKWLRIKYMFKGREHQTTVFDIEEVRLPLQEHLIG